MNSFDKIMSIFILIGFAALVSSIISPIFKDNPKEIPGVHVLTFVDQLTGCQYLLPMTGGMIPRMNPNGTQICELQPKGMKM